MHGARMVLKSRIDKVLRTQCVFYSSEWDVYFGAITKKQILNSIEWNNKKNPDSN